jgi:hypothetical protein
MLMLSLDPGGTTGAALVQYFENEEPELKWARQIPNGLQGFLDFHWDELLSYDIDEIVCENFTLREGVYGADLSPVYVIGALEALYERGRTPITYQPPSSKPLCDDDRLKRIGMHSKGRPHANDAVRHAIIYLRNKLHKPTLRLGWSSDE